MKKICYVFVCMLIPVNGVVADEIWICKSLDALDSVTFTNVPVESKNRSCSYTSLRRGSFNRVPEAAFYIKNNTDSLLGSGFNKGLEKAKNNSRGRLGTGRRQSRRSK